MKLSDLKSVLDSSGIPFAYYSWPVDKAPPPLPWGVYLEAYGRSFGADNTAYSAVRHMQVELYFAKKDPVLEKRLEDVLTGASIFFEKTDEVYLESEKCFETLYELEVLNDG
jgi:hypothetical protein